MKLETAQAILNGALAEARAKTMKPLAVVVLDARGAIRAVAAEDDTSAKRAEIALGKANGCIALGLGSRAIAARQPNFLIGALHAVGGHGLMAVPGGVLIRENGAILGAIGISGDTSDNDEIAAIAGIEGQGLTADTGA